MAIYYIDGPLNVLHEYTYTSKGGWVLGYLHTLNIKLDPTSSITAAHNCDGSYKHIHVFYQGRCHDLLHKELIK